MSYKGLIDENPNSVNFNKIIPTYLPSSFNPVSKANSILVVGNYPNIEIPSPATQPIISLPFTNSFSIENQLKLRFNLYFNQAGTYTPQSYVYFYVLLTGLNGQQIFLTNVTYTNPLKFQIGDATNTIAPIAGRSISFCDFLDFESQQQNMPIGASCTVQLFIISELTITGNDIKFSAELQQTGN